jgi:site-specific DNA-methyltransferase (adenine-specific)
MTTPTPYYRDDVVTIYHGDSREIVPTLPRHDLLITDPPYGMRYRSNRRAIRHDPIAGDGQFPTEDIAAFIDRCDRAAYVFCRWDNLLDDTLPGRPKSIIAWVKNNWGMGDLKHTHGRQWESILFYPLAGHRFHKRIPDVVQCPRTANNLHPTEKPVELIERLVDSNVGETILDPYAGSGATGLAAANAGRRATLIECDEQYCEIAARRMDAAKKNRNC